MQEVIDSSVNELIQIIESKPNSRSVAWQFILEELDAAKEGTSFVKDRIETFYISQKEYLGAMGRSWDDVDGLLGPQQYLVNLTMAIADAVGIEVAAMVRITIVEYILKHYGFGRYYLDDSVRKAKKPLDLFTLTTTEDKLHPHFKWLLDDANEEIRKVILRWSSGFEDRDNKFNHEFQTTFNSSFWEIYLNQCFSDLKMSIDYSKAMPDFTVKTRNNKLLNIEAVTANHAIDSSPEWSKGKIREDDFLNFSCVRILNAINSKYIKYIKSYSKLKHVGKNPYIIAVAPYEQPYFFAQNNEAIIRVLYGQGIDMEKGFKEVSVPTAQKNEDVTLDLGIFTNDKHKEISAIIFSTTATMGKAISQTPLDRTVRFTRYSESQGLITGFVENAKYFETHLDGLQIHHNPFAENPIDESDFDTYEITHYFYDVVNNEIDNQQKNYTLISRNTFENCS